MKFSFNINYGTIFGEALVVNILDGDHVERHQMTSADGSQWNANVDIPQAPSQLKYYYSVTRGAQRYREEWQTLLHAIDVSAQKANHYVAYDQWVDTPADAYLYTSAFTDCVNRQHPKPLPATHYARTLRLKVRAPQLKEGEWLAILGAGDKLGNWKALEAKDMTQHQYNEWAIDFNADDFKDQPMEFKFVIRDSQVDYTPEWEVGCNRVIQVPDMREGEAYVYQLGEARFNKWDRKLAGTLVPVFSLRSKRSFGVGDFGDLRQMIDLVAMTGQKVLQVLPVNDTTTTHTWTDSYPYSAISIFALHPQFVDLNALPALKDAAKREEMEALRQELNALPQIDYERVNDTKTAYMRLLFAQEGAKAMRAAEYKHFFDENQRWLVPYARYCTLREKYGTANFTTWPDHNVWDEDEREQLSNSRTALYKEAAFYYYTQFVLFQQLRDAHAHAQEKGVILKGDIPIGVNRHGCDVWMEPKYFNLNGQAGAPPDSFSVNGQNWGLPTYNWEEMLKDDCAWWTKRFQHMQQFFDAYRIDHVLGFFRIWEIPIDSVHGLLGQFSPALGMSRQEIAQYGLNFQEERFTTPFITDWVLQRVFSERAQEVKERFLEPIDGERYRLREEVNTQRKVESLFAHADKQEELWLRDGLYALISDVLFLRDRKDPNLFHPRISAQYDFIYESLYDCDKEAFNRLYNDYFYRRHNQFWYREAMRKLPRLVQATRMLVCAEDLGMVPDCVPWVLEDLKILSLEIQSMPKDPNVRFGYLSKNPYRSVCTISSHDMPTLRQWWDEDYERTQDYFNSMLYRGGSAPHPLPGWLARDIISRHLLSGSMLCVISLQDWLAMDEKLRLPDANAERINIPSNPKHYWRYRMHLNLEDLAADKRFIDSLTELIRLDGRI